MRSGKHYKISTIRFAKFFIKDFKLNLKNRNKLSRIGTEKVTSRT